MRFPVRISRGFVKNADGIGMRLYRRIHLIGISAPETGPGLHAGMLTGSGRFRTSIQMRRFRCIGVSVLVSAHAAFMECIAFVVTVCVDKRCDVVVSHRGSFGIRIRFAAGFTDMLGIALCLTGRGDDPVRVDMVLGLRDISGLCQPAHPTAAPFGSDLRTGRIGDRIPISEIVIGFFRDGIAIAVTADLADMFGITFRLAGGFYCLRLIVVICFAGNSSGFGI